MSYKVACIAQESRFACWPSPRQGRHRITRCWKQNVSFHRISAAILPLYFELDQNLTFFLQFETRNNYLTIVSRVSTFLLEHEFKKRKKGKRRRTQDDFFSNVSYEAIKQAR
ncbi:hypothetical protein Naga_100129g8 [Nannochloropsis gaditana]|uniref:Uncharacterized protein n=1 Tax=Nannochloropsis gaditana TaxID=72520 RepID=W7U4A0_9STRA|nr:hypothetical protein Naga_100129g8 [Nannochloropsis gaditana]